MQHGVAGLSWCDLGCRPLTHYPPSTQVGTVAGISDDINEMRVGRDDFMAALEEVHASFGVSEEELGAVVQNGIIHFGGDVEVSFTRFVQSHQCVLFQGDPSKLTSHSSTHFQTILRDGNLFVEQVRNSQRTPLVSVLLHGEIRCSPELFDILAMNTFAYLHP